MSSARAVRCRLKCHNERNPCCQLLTGDAEDSDKTAIVRCEEGGDDVKSARPLRPGLHTCYNGGYRGPLPREWMPIPKTPLSSDWSLQPDSTKLDSLVIAHQPRRGEYVPGPCTHQGSRTGRCGWNTSFLERTKDREGFCSCTAGVVYSRYDSVMIRKRESKKPGLIKQTRLNLVL